MKTNKFHLFCEWIEKASFFLSRNPDATLFRQAIIKRDYSAFTMAFFTFECIL